MQQRHNKPGRNNAHFVPSQSRTASQKKAVRTPPIQTATGKAVAHPPYTPMVGISNRPGFGYDSKALTENKGAPIRTASLPPNHTALERDATKSELARELKAVQDDRDLSLVNEHLENVDGLYIPGGQDNLDRERNGNVEKESREEYEQALIKRARNLGMPMLGVCGGSRSLARGFGGQEQSLNEHQISIHNQKGTSAIAHSLHFSNVPQSRDTFAPDQFFGLLGGAAQHKGRVKTIVDKINAMNSTHQKIVAFDNHGEMVIRDDVGTDRLIIKGKVVEVKRKLIEGQPEVMFTTWDGTGKNKTPEGFETRYGAPVMGITSHPEAISGTNTARTAFKDHRDAIGWSDNIFKDFAQSMTTYAHKKKLLLDLKSGKKTALKQVKTVERNGVAVVSTEAKNKLPGRLKWRYNTESTELIPATSVKLIPVTPSGIKPKVTDKQLTELFKEQPDYNAWQTKTWIANYKVTHPENDYS